MGEARRRKLLLGSDYGKPQTLPASDVSPEDCQLVQVRADIDRLGVLDKEIPLISVNWSDDLDTLSSKGCYLAGQLLIKMGFTPGTPDAKISVSAISLLSEVNFFSELYGLYRINPCPKSDSFNSARLVMFTALCTLLVGDSSSESAAKANSLIKEAGRLIYEAVGSKGLRDNLIWLFIPKQYQRIVDLCFNGIGGWSS